MVTWVLTTRWRFDFERQTRLFCWTSPSFAVLGERFCDLASALTSGVALWRIAFTATRFSCKPSQTKLRQRVSGYCVTREHSDRHLAALNQF
jgi:hypothetical protein